MMERGGRTMMSNTSDQQVAQVNWCDLVLHGVSWIENGRDVVLNFRVPFSDRKLGLTCQWARGLRISLEFKGDSGGCALSWNAEVKRNTDGDWHLSFDFGAAGQISLVCNELEISYDVVEETKIRSDSVD